MLVFPKGGPSMLGLYLRKAHTGNGIIVSQGGVGGMAGQEI